MFRPWKRKRNGFLLLLISLSEFDTHIANLHHTDDCELAQVYCHVAMPKNTTEAVKRLPISDGQITHECPHWVEAV